MNLKDATITFQMYLDAHRTGTVELDSRLMLQELPYAVEVVLNHLLQKERSASEETASSPGDQEMRNKIRDALEGRL
jgi:hypothetical protein